MTLRGEGSKSAGKKPMTGASASASTSASTSASIGAGSRDSSTDSASSRKSTQPTEYMQSQRDMCELIRDHAAFIYPRFHVNGAVRHADRMAELAVIVVRGYHQYFAAVLADDELLLEGPLTSTREQALDLLLEVASCVAYETVQNVREASVQRFSEGRPWRIESGGTPLLGYQWNRRGYFDKSQWALHRA